MADGEVTVEYSDDDAALAVLPARRVTRASVAAAIADGTDEETALIRASGSERRRSGRVRVRVNVSDATAEDEIEAGPMLKFGAVQGYPPCLPSAQRRTRRSMDDGGHTG